MSSAPILADITVDGKPRKAVARAEQAGIPLRLRSRDRRAGLADRREAGAAGRRAGREVRADAAVSDASRRRTARNASQSPDDLIDFTPELRAQALEESRALQVVSAASIVQPADRRQRQRAARRDQHGERRRRHELAGRRLRSGDAHRLRAGGNGVDCRRSVAPPPPGFSDIRYVAGVAGQPFRRGKRRARATLRRRCRRARPRARAAAGSRRQPPARGAGRRRRTRRPAARAA